MPSNPLTNEEIINYGKLLNYPTGIFFATNPNTPSGMGWYDIDNYITGLGYIKSLAPTWIQLVTGYKVGTEPTLIVSLPTGDVYEYTFETASADVTYYRRIGATEDAFYRDFDGTNLTNIITIREYIW